MLRQMNEQGHWQEEGGILEPVWFIQILNNIHMNKDYVQV